VVPEAHHTAVSLPPPRATLALIDETTPCHPAKPAHRFPQTIIVWPGKAARRAQYTACLPGNSQKQDMQADDSSDTLLNRLAQLELLVQIQKEEIRRISLERDLFAAWYDATKASPARPAPRAAAAEAC
jgi:hypothetical protein